MEMFDKLKDNSYWTGIDADKTEADLHVELLEAVDKTIATSETRELSKLWWHLQSFETRTFKE